MDELFEYSIENDKLDNLLEDRLLEYIILIGILALARSYGCVSAIFIWKTSPTRLKTHMSLRTLQIVKQAEFKLSLGFKSLESKSKENRQHE